MEISLEIALAKQQNYLRRQSHKPADHVALCIPTFSLQHQPEIMYFRQCQKILQEHLKEEGEQEDQKLPSSAVFPSALVHLNLKTVLFLKYYQ